MYNLIVKKQAKKKLLSMPAGLRVKIAGSISMLGKDPDDKRLDIKKNEG